MAQCVEIAVRTGEQCIRPTVAGSDRCVSHRGIETSTTPDAIRVRVDHPRVRCHATRANSGGVQCGQWATPGSQVCRYHGSATPQAKKKAKERLLEAIDPALVQLQRIIDKPDTTDSDRLRAIQLVLDRTGYHAKTEVTQEVTVKPWESLVQNVTIDTGQEPTVIEGQVLPNDTMADLQARYDQEAEDALPDADIIEMPAPVVGRLKVPSHLR